MKKVSTLGIDLAKSVFQLHGNNCYGKAVLKKKLSRSQLKSFIINLEPCLIGMEACSGSHYWAREFEKMGHTVKLIAPQFVKPYVKTNKNDEADAEAIAEAVSRPNMRFVPIKQTGHQDIQSVHRIRQRLVRNKTALANEARGLLHEYGVVIPQSLTQLRKHIPLILEDTANGLTPLLRELIRDLWGELKDLEERIVSYDLRIKQIYETHEECQRIGKIEGIGPVTATAMIASVSNPHVFKNGRELAAWVGLVPRQHSSGGKSVLLGISKRGDSYLRGLLIHGSRSVLRRAASKTDSKSRWMTKIRDNRGFNKACVALANKNARIIWALLARKEEYRRAA